MTTADTPSGLTDAQYHAAIQAVLARIESTVDRWLETDVADIDAARSGGLLTLTLPNRSQLIINAQPPLHELWLAAKRGGFHFRHVDGQWRDTRSGDEFFALLSACAAEQTGLALAF
ncbi:MAG: iron donor protein CyaY [Burkholderiales bacterium]|nr:iron donor protein CyaY [Burkholderiales bacterium]